MADDVGANESSSPARDALAGAVSRLDAIAGAGIERTVRAHHRRRLARIGRLDQLDPPQDPWLWAGGDPPPREGCSMEVLIDGAAALPAIADELGRARSHIHIAGWHLTPAFGLTRDSRAAGLRDLLAELALRVEVRVLLWAGAPLPVFTPDRSRVRAERDELTRGSGVVCALDSRERPMHCHHEKLVIVDDEVAFVGGIDLTSLGGDRFDSSEHPVRGRLGWHDVATRLHGPVVADVAEHFACRWREADGSQTPAVRSPAAAGDSEVQLVRTIPERIYGFAPKGDFRILESYLRALRAARRFVYLESQFLWSSQIVAVLTAKLRQPPTDGFRIVVVLPAKANNGEDATRGQIGVLIDADAGNGRFLATTVCARSGRLGGPLYVHAKVAVVDDEWLTVGSANLNEHSLFNDTEVNVVSCDRRLARETRLRLWAEHLERSVEEVGGEPAQVVDELWRPIAVEQRQRDERGDAPTHRLRELPGVSRRSLALLGPLQGVFVDG